MKTHIINDKHCKEFKSNPTVNPLTGRKIKMNGPTYNELKSKCASNDYHALPNDIMNKIVGEVSNAKTKRNLRLVSKNVRDMVKTPKSFEQNIKFFKKYIDSMKHPEHGSRIHIFSKDFVLTIGYYPAYVKQVNVTIQHRSKPVEKFGYGVVMGMIPDFVSKSKIYHTHYTLSPTAKLSLSKSVIDTLTKATNSEMRTVEKQASFKTATMLMVNKDVAHRSQHFHIILSNISKIYMFNKTNKKTTPQEWLDFLSS